jgi:hypothetical protein
MLDDARELQEILNGSVEKGLADQDNMRGT